MLLTPSHMRILTYKLYSILLFILIAFLISSCDLYRTYKCPSYVVCYNDLRSVKLEPLESNDKGLCITGGNDTPVVSFHLNSTGKEKDMYDWLCNKHHDNSYNQFRSFLIASDSVTYNNQDFSSIEIFSDTVFDENHPFGGNLADVVRFLSWSPYKYIYSGYKEYYQYTPGSLSDTFESIMPIYFGRGYTQTKSTCHPVDKMVNELTSEDLILLGRDSPWLIGILVFEALPTNKGDQNITVRMTTDTGIVFEDVIRITF